MYNSHVCTDTFNIHIINSKIKKGLWWKLVGNTYLDTEDSRSPVCGWGFDREEEDRLQSHTGLVHCGMYIVCKNQYSTSLLLQSIPHQEHDRLKDWWALASAQLFHLEKTELDDKQNQSRLQWLKNIPNLYLFLLLKILGLIKLAINTFLMKLF